MGIGRPSFERWRSLALFLVMPVVTLMMTFQWWCVRRDMRERRLRVDEAELTSKWTHRRARPTGSAKGRSHPRGFCTLVFRWLATELKGEPDEEYHPEAFVDGMWVRLGPRMVDVRSPPLFEQLGSSVRYRIYLSAHAGQLVAIESVEIPLGGYRDVAWKRVVRKAGA